MTASSAPTRLEREAAPPCVLSFDALARRNDDEIDVALGAALLARDVYANLDVGSTLARFDALAAPLQGRSLGTRPLYEQAIDLGHHLYEVEGFRGNEANYYDPKNSLLPDVLDRRLGIPITLALVYCEVARRCGVVARGVSFPGHFLVRIDGKKAPGMERGLLAPPAPPLFVDPFFGGRLLDDAALERVLRRAAGPNESVKEEHLVPASPRSILVRMLINLKWIYMTRGDLARAHLALDRIVSLTPDAPAALRERGLLAARLGAVEAARADLTRLLEIHPDTADAKAIRTRLDELRDAKRVLN